MRRGRHPDRRQSGRGWSGGGVHILYTSCHFDPRLPPRRWRKLLGGPDPPPGHAVTPSPDVYPPAGPSPTTLVVNPPNHHLKSWSEESQTGSTITANLCTALYPPNHPFNTRAWSQRGSSITGNSRPQLSDNPWRRRSILSTATNYSRRRIELVRT